MLSNEKRIEIRQFAIDWNNKFPLDFWYRRRYNIRFNSKKHRSVNLIDVLIEFEEVLVIQEYRERGIKVENDLFLQETTGRWLSPRVFEPTQEEIEFAFNNMDLSKFDDK